MGFGIYFDFGAWRSDPLPRKCMGIIIALKFLGEQINVRTFFS
jgi:hypothetical protein